MMPPSQERVDQTMVTISIEIRMRIHLSPTQVLWDKVIRLPGPYLYRIGA